MQLQYKHSGPYLIEMNFDYVLCRKCMQNLQEAAGAALTLASTPAIMIAERKE